MSEDHIVWHPPSILRNDRNRLNGHKSCVLWLTGLSGSGKSTLAYALEKELFALQCRSYVLDGDNIRHGLNKNLGFTPSDRTENIRRVAEVAKLFVDAGIIALTAFISPYRADRDMARALFDEGDFIEVYVHCSLDECERRDPKGLYRKAKAGDIPQFTGVSAPYERPLRPEIRIDTDRQTVDEAAVQIMEYLSLHRYLARDNAE